MSSNSDSVQILNQNTNNNNNKALVGPIQPVNKNGFHKPRFVVGEDILTVETDEIFRLGTVKFIKFPQYLIRFDDNSELWYNETLLRRLCSGKITRKAELCETCERKYDPLLFCDKCHKEIHKPCTNETHKGYGERFWDCWNCKEIDIYHHSKGIQAKDADSKEIFISKSQLPYKFDDLEWDDKHQRNKQQQYCYCGEDGEYLRKMLQCFGCRQWFHQRCLRHFKLSMLFGDFFFIFRCTVCQKGNEYLRRLELNWMQMIKLVLYHLQEYYCCKYHDLDTVFIPFCSKNWSRLMLPEPMQHYKRVRDFKSQIYQTIVDSGDNEFIVKYDDPSKKEKFLFGLKTREPPLPLKLNLIDAHFTDNYLESAGVKFIMPINILQKLSIEKEPKMIQKNHIIQNGTQCESNLHPVVVVKKTTANNNLLRKRSNTLPDPPEKVQRKQSMKNGIKVTESKKTSKLEDNKKDKWIFRSIIDEYIGKLPNYDGENNPFHRDNFKLTSAEIATLYKIRVHHLNRKDVKRTRKRKDNKPKINRKTPSTSNNNNNNNNNHIVVSNSVSVSSASSMKSSSSSSSSVKDSKLKQLNNNNCIRLYSDSYEKLNELMKLGDEPNKAEIVLKTPSKLRQNFNANFIKIIDAGDKIADFDVVAERLLDDGTKQYLINWDSSCPKFILDAL